MKRKGLVSLLIASVVASSILVASTTTAERVVAQTPMEAATEYFQAYIAMAGQDYEQSPPLPYKIFKSENGWKVLVEPLEINTLTGEVTKGTPIHALQYTDH